MSKIAIVGSGVIGQGWAVVFARAGHDAVLFDAQPGATDTALRRIDDIVARLIGIDDEDRESVRGRIRGAASLAEALEGAVHVQESITENAGAKRAVFIEMDAIAPPDVILASSCSAIPPDEFLTDVPGRRRCLIAHPFNPPYLVPVVEMLSNSWTDEVVLEQCTTFMRECGQSPIRVHVPVPGFVINRLQVAVVNEAMNLVARGVASPQDIDTGMREGLGLRWAIFGPFETMNSNAVNGFREYTGKYAGSYRALGDDLQPGAAWDPEALESVASYLDALGWSNEEVEHYRDELVMKIRGIPTRRTTP
jgi:3-hydroxyacyl-CoA dehydrogenase